jgi:hypothetical protein
MIFGILMVSLVGEQTVTVIDGHMDFLTAFALFFAALVLFKFFFAAMYQVRNIS